MSEDTGLGSEESSSCECFTAVWPPPNMSTEC